MSSVADDLDHNADDRIECAGFEVTLRTHRRTAIVELFGELDLVTVAQVADAFDSLALGADGFRHVVLDLRGLTFMDATGVHELFRRSNDADQNSHNLAVVRGRPSISKLMSITALDAHLVMVEAPEDLIPPLSTSAAAENRRGGSFSGVA
jgi:anti-anti-sigma factor